MVTCVLPKGEQPDGIQNTEDTTMNPYTLRKHFTLLDYNTAISREDFENNFRRTAERVTFTFNGWDGASYSGETRTARVYRTTVKGYEDMRFVKVGKHLCYIDEDSNIIEQATGIAHKEAEWLVEVQRRG